MRVFMTTDTIVFNENTREIHWAGKTQVLTEKEARLFFALQKDCGHVVTHDQLISSVWPGREAGVTETNLLQLVCRLRRSLAQSDLSGAVKTVYRQGYTLVLPTPTNAPHQISGDLDTRRRPFVACRVLGLCLLSGALLYQYFPSPQRTLITFFVRVSHLSSLTLSHTRQGLVLDYQTCDNQHIHRVISLD
ncbi:winged helix family transcriptional regulator [Salmonella enterica]|nr:winged helix family transcriptional regulator [Salmonella enterica]EBS4388759.1 winged helix family transcriptional regulator [Salmonella enterica subsp. enterica serovar Panama]EBS5590087.1 winged helix family transcriptional regulator [Salmonella enterica subsp. enterica serovar Newport]ECW3064043.1 winged helix-turn-helix transcriptional regulator [Salmonella enterica subsp. enterica serovar Rubislaw]EAO7829546.1 winged helix family transcriptional regulator [Salmonella enterica]